MGTITKRQKVDGKFTYTAQIRIKRPDKTTFNKTRTFKKESDAKDWIKRIEAELLVNPELLNSESTAKHKTLADLIKKYLEEAEGFARTKTWTLNYLASLSISEKNIYSLTRQDFSDHALYRRKGDPSIGLEGVAPSTVLKELSHVKAVLVHAEYVWGEDVGAVITEYEKALAGLRKSRIVTKSKTRDRLPTSQELQTLTTHFYKSWKREKRSVPMHLIIWFAIYSGRRENEICSLQLNDYDQYNSQWLVRDAKHPDGSKGNHKYAHLEPKAIHLVNLFMEPDMRSRMLELGYDSKLLIPVSSRTVSSFFTRACKACGIEGLRFHDLRHEAATRYAEDGFSIPKLQTITLHESWNTLKRYVNLKKRGHRLEFEEALYNAEEGFNTHFKEWNKTQRSYSEMDQFEAFGLNRSDEIITPYSFIKEQLAEFIEQHKQDKFFIRKHVKKLDTKQPFAWNKDKQEFYIAEIQIAWLDWFAENGTVEWSELPKEASHFSFKNNHVIRLFKNRVLEFDQELEAWMDISDNYYLDERLHLSKD